MDWQWIQSELAKLKLLDFTKTCFALCRKWFDLEMPIETGDLDPDFYSVCPAKLDHTSRCKSGHSNRQ